MLEIEIEGKRTGKQEGKIGGSLIRFGEFGAGEFYNFGMQTNGLLDQSLFGLTGSVSVIVLVTNVLHERNFGAEKCSLLIHLKDLEPIDPSRKNIHSAVLVLFCDGENFSGATNASHTVARSSHNAKGPFLLEAFGNHFLITRLKNVQRKRRSGEQNQIKRE